MPALIIAIHMLGDKMSCCCLPMQVLQEALFNGQLDGNNDKPEI